MLDVPVAFIHNIVSSCGEVNGLVEFWRDFLYTPLVEMSQDDKGQVFSCLL